MSMGEWLRQNTHLRGRPFSFARYPFQKQITDDMHWNMDVIKPSQVGLTEIQIRKTLAFLARNRDTTAIFSFPTEKMYKKQSTTRIKPLVEREDAFNKDTPSGEKPARSMHLYQVGTSFMHVSGATEGDATSISADLVMNDEVDLTDQQMLALFNSRLQNSDWKINHRFSTPTFSNFGVDKGYMSSDQHEYPCKCSACGHWNIPLFERKFIEIPGLSDDIGSLTEIDEVMIDNHGIDLGNAFVKCEKCSAPLPLGDPDAREWVSRYPSRTHHRGYRVSPFSTDRLSIEYIITQMFSYQSRDYLRGWYNTVLGQAYTDGNSRLAEADIEMCFTGRMEVPEVDATKPTWIAADIGQTCHVGVGQGDSVENLEIIRWVEVPIGGLKDFVEDMLTTYNVVGGACDRYPYTPNAEEIRDVSQGKILPIDYRGQKPVNPVKDDLTGETSYVQMNRTQLIDSVAAAVRRKRWRFSGYGAQKQTIKDHLRDMVRDESPEKEAKWVKLSNNDHYFHMLAFMAGAIKAKEAEFGLFQDPRGTVSVGSADVIVSSQGLIGGNQTPALFGGY